MMGEAHLCSRLADFVLIVPLRIVPLASQPPHEKRGPGGEDGEADGSDHGEADNG